MKFKIVFLAFILMFLSSCNTDYLNIDESSSNILISSSEVFNIITKGVSNPNLKSLNENELLDIYAIDPKILADYSANISNDQSSINEISVFKVKDKNNIGEVTLGLQHHLNILEDTYKNTTQSNYDIIKNPYTRIIDNYVIFILNENRDEINKEINKLFNI